MELSDVQKHSTSHLTGVHRPLHTTKHYVHVHPWTCTQRNENLLEKDPRIGQDWHKNQKG